MCTMPTTVEFCKCTRPVRPQHCANCGSTNIYGKSTISVKYQLPSGEEILLKGFRCRKCLTEFNQGTPCEAPVFESKSMKERREQEALSENTRKAIAAAGGRVAYLAEQLRKQGVPEEQLGAYARKPAPTPEPKSQAEPETAISEWLDDKLNLKPISAEPLKPLDKIAPNTEPGGFKETNPMFEDKE
jgi:hypothetical protein